MAHRVVKLEFVPQTDGLLVNALGQTARGTRTRIASVKVLSAGKSPAEFVRARAAAIEKLLAPPK